VGCDFSALVLKLLREELAHGVDCEFVVAGRFDFHHALKQGEHFRLVVVAKVEVLGDGGLHWPVTHGVVIINVLLPLEFFSEHQDFRSRTDEQSCGIQAWAEQIPPGYSRAEESARELNARSE